MGIAVRDTFPLFTDEYYILFEKIALVLHLLAAMTNVDTAG